MKAGKMEVRPKRDQDLREKSVPGLGRGKAAPGRSVGRVAQLIGSVTALEGRISGPFLPGELWLSECLTGSNVQLWSAERAAVTGRHP